MSWEYEPGEKRFKHKWSKDYAGFEMLSGRPVGKCPKSVDNTLAEKLLNSGIEWSNLRLSHGFPSAIYNVHEGVIYKAVATNPGRSYHGYPFRGRIPVRVLDCLEELAQENGWETEFKAWVGQNISR